VLVGELRAELELLRDSLKEQPGLSCEPLRKLLSRSHAFGFSLAPSDIRRRAPARDALDELRPLLQLPVGLRRPMDEDRDHLAAWRNSRPRKAPAAASRQLGARHRRDLRGFSHAGAVATGIRRANLPPFT